VREEKKEERGERGEGRGKRKPIGRL